jgi:uncharacterized protein YqgV (UPF0045/DUF77 family)
VVQRIHGVLHAGGAPRLATSIKIGTRVDKMGTPVGKERAITDFDSQ